MQLSYVFSIGDRVRVTGRDGTNGPLVFGHVYEVIELTDENDSDSEHRNLYGYSLRPIVVRSEEGVEYRPFLGKIELVK